jgi:hypothetical protein
MRDILVRGYAEQCIENVAANKNGRCLYRFVANLVQEAASVAEVLKISNRDIKGRKSWPNEGKSHQNRQACSEHHLQRMKYTHHLVSIYSLVLHPNPIRYRQ